VASALLSPAGMHVAFRIGFLAMQSKLFWAIFPILSFVAGVYLPLLWGIVASLPIAVFSWWIVYRSDWF
jgi:hypothetical protein